ncbi:MAG: protein kinase [Polyangiaceae bacterium]
MVGFASEPAEVQLLGTILDEKYRIERLLGQGGMGAVYVAEDVRTHERVAVKVIQAHLASRVPDLAQRFEREARAAGSIDNEHIARCLDAGTDEPTGQPYMVLELLHGDDFDHVLRKLGPVDPELAVCVTAQAALGLARAHEAGVVHRDIKPANLFLHSRADAPGERVVKILDFGVAKILDDPDQGAGHDGLTRTGSLLGSPLYMSPEQARSVKNVDPRTDVWSLGVVLYRALAGRTPFEHVSGLGDLVLALWNEPPPPVQQFAPWVTPEVASVLDRMLRAEPGERYQTMKEVHAALAALLPRGITIREEMLVALGTDVRARTAQTFFRRLDTRNRMPTNPGPVQAMTAQPPSSALGTTPGGTSALPRAPTLSRPSASELASTEALDISGVAAAGTHNGYVTTDPGATRVRPPAPAPARSSMVWKGALVAVVGVAAGIGVTVMLLQARGPATAGVAPTAEPTITQTEPAPTITPVVSTSSSAAETTAPEPSAEPTTSATTVASTAPRTTSSAPATTAPPVLTGTRPKPTATSQPTATKPPGFTDFGDRK